MENYIRFTEQLALDAGSIMMTNFQKKGMQREWKKDNSPLTKTDLAINNLVTSRIKSSFPTHGIIAEEGSCYNNEEYVWVCDPVDGTMPFSHGYPTFTFSLALIHSGYPIIGVLYDPILNRMILAEKNNGAYLDNERINVSESISLERSLIALELNSPIYNPLRDSLIKSGCYIFSFACISYSSLLVAIGEFRGSIWYGKSPWDGAAVQIIIDEAGGVCTDIYGNMQRYDQEIKGIVASNKYVHPILINMIRGSLS